MSPLYSEFHFDSLQTWLNQNGLAAWGQLLPQQVERGLCPQRFGDLDGWLKDLRALPDITATQLELRDSVSLSGALDQDSDGDSDGDSSSDIAQQIDSALRGLIPWRKGPWKIYNTAIDTEWRSDWKWQRLQPHISSLANKKVLDVGCGNGYHCLRMFGEKAERVIGVDPSPRFVIQFYMIVKPHKNISH